MSPRAEVGGTGVVGEWTFADVAAWFSEKDDRRAIFLVATPELITMATKIALDAVGDAYDGGVRDSDLLKEIAVDAYVGIGVPLPTAQVAVELLAEIVDFTLHRFCSC